MSNGNSIYKANERTPTPVLALRPSEAADAIGVSERTLAAWMKNVPGFPVVRIGGVRLIPTRELQEWLGSQTSESGGPS